MAVAFGTTILGTSSSSSTSAAVNFTGRSAGEYALVLISRDNTSTPTTTPSGWTLLQALSSTYRHMLYGKVLASGDIGTVTWSGFTAGKTLAQAVVYTGVNQTTPVAASTAGTFATGSGRTIGFGSLNTSAPWIVALAGCYSTSSKTYDVSSEGLTERLDYGHTNPDFWQYIGDKTHSGGTFAPSTSTNYISANATYRGGFLVALNRAPETHDLTLGIESVSSVTAEGAEIAAVCDLTLGVESSSAVSASAARNVIGNTNPGSTLYDGMNDWYMQEVFAGPPVSGVVCTKLYAYVNNGATACKAAMGIHELASGTSGNWTHLGHSNAVDIAANQAWGWVEFALQSPVNLRSDRYYLIELFGNENAGVMNTHWDGTSGLGNVRNSRDFDSGFPSSGTFYPSSYQTFPFYGRYTPVADLALGIESTSAVSASGSETAGGATHDVTLAVESASSVSSSGAATQAVLDVTLAAESVSAVATSVAVVQAIQNIVLAIEATSTASATGAATQAVWEVTLALESASALTTTGNVAQAVADLVLATESVSAVTTSAAKSAIVTHDMALAIETVSAITAGGAVTQALWDLALAAESVSAVNATAATVQAVVDVLLAVEAVSTVTTTGAEVPAGVVHDLALALASASSLVASAAVTQAVQELSLGPEAASSVTAAGASLEAIIDLALVLEAKSNVGAQVLVVQALCDLALAVESTSAVAATATFLRYRPNVDLAAALVESGWKADVDTAGMCARLASHGYDAELADDGWSAVTATEGWQATLTGS